MSIVPSNGPYPLQAPHHNNRNRQENHQGVLGGRKVTQSPSPLSTFKKIVHLTPVIQTIYGLGMFLKAAANIPINRYKICQLKGVQGQRMSRLQKVQDLLYNKMKESLWTALPFYRTAEVVNIYFQRLLKRF